MANPPVVGYRFHPTDVEIIDGYLRPKNVLDGDTSHVDREINTVTICSFDPKELSSQSIKKSEDQVWYFFGRKENKYKTGDRQIRKTKSGFWKKTGKPVIIKRKNGQKIGEKWVLVFHLSKTLKTKWIMHEYHVTPTPDKMMMTFTFCKLKFKGEESEISSPPPPSGGEIEHNHSSINHMINNSEGGRSSTGSEVGPTFECRQRQEIDNQERQFSDVFEETRLEDAIRKALDNLTPDELNNLLNDDGDDDPYEEQSRNIMFMQEDRNDHRPKKPITGVFIGHSSDDDNDSESISVVTSSIETLSYFDSFGSSNHRVDQITNLQESPNSTIKLSPKVSHTPGQETEIGEHKLGEEKIKNKRAGFFYRTIQRFIKKIQLCTSI